MQNDYFAVWKPEGKITLQDLDIWWVTIKTIPDEEQLDYSYRTE